MFAHLFQTGSQILDQLLLDPEGDGQIRVLMSRIDGQPHKKVDIGCVFEQFLRNLAGTILPNGPLRRQTGVL